MSATTMEKSIPYLVSRSTSLPKPRAQIEKETSLLIEKSYSTTTITWENKYSPNITLKGTWGHCEETTYTFQKLLDTGLELTLVSGNPKCHHAFLVRVWNFCFWGLKKNFIVIQLQLCAFSPHPSTPPQVNPPPSPTSTLPLDFVHVSFIVVPVIPSSHCTPPGYC